MNAASIIREAHADGVRLVLSLVGTIKATGDGAAVSRWLSTLRDHKAEIIDALKAGRGDVDSLTAREEAAIRGWLALIEETDPATIDEVICRCRWSADVRDYFNWRAESSSPPA